MAGYRLWRLIRQGNEKMSIKIKIIIVSFLLFLPLLGGCSSLPGKIFPLLDGSSTLTGWVFTHTRIPYTQDLNNTPVSNIHARGMVFHAEEPLSGYNFYIEFNSNAIGDIAKKHGLSKVYFADIEIFSVLGIWWHETLHIYGEKNQLSEKENSRKKGGENEK